MQNNLFNSCRKPHYITYKNSGNLPRLHQYALLFTWPRYTLLIMCHSVTILSQDKGNIYTLKQRPLLKDNGRSVIGFTRGMKGCILTINT